MGTDPISMSRGGVASLYLADGHSGVRQAVGVAGGVQLAQRFDAFRNTVAKVGTLVSPVGYRGERLDGTLGQYSLRARFYDPRQGRFTATDPYAGTYGDPLQAMRYGYAGGSPVANADPSGREFSVGGMLSGISIGLAVSSINPHAAGTGQDTAFSIGFGISGALGCSGVAAFKSLMGLPMGIALGAAVGFYGGFIAGYADALADDPLVSEDKLLATAWVSGILGAIQGVLAFTYLGGKWGRGRGACFAAGTPLLTPGGSTPIEQLKPGDFVLARDEFDCAGPVEAKAVEEVFVYESQVLRLTVGGERIGTTGEHPFYVRGRGWVAAGELDVGDVVAGHDGQDQAVQAVEAGEWAMVYNLRVADHHTYFVGRTEWGFSVWAHNACINYLPLDNLGRATGVEANLDKSVYQKGSKATFSPPGYNAALGHAKGHLLAQVLGGNGKEPRNIVTMFQNPTNNSWMKTVENRVRDAIKIGTEVDYEVMAVYSGTELIPHTIRVRYLNKSTGAGGFIWIPIPNRSWWR